MVYKRNTWQSGDKVTSAKLNNLEEGSVAVFHFTAAAGTPSQFTLDGTFRDVWNTARAGIPAFLTINPPGGTDAAIFTVARAYLSDNSANLTALDASGQSLFLETTEDPDSHPTMTWE